MKNKTPDKEVDLLELFLVIWKDKLKILFISIIFIIIGLVYNLSINSNKTIYKINSEIQPISITEETKYNIFNSYIYNYYSDNEDLLKMSPELMLDSMDFYKNHAMETTVQFLALNYDKKLLFNLFLKKMSSQKRLQEYLREFKLFKKDDYKDSALLLESFLDVSVSIKQFTSKNVKPISINIKTYNYKQTLEFLEFLNNKINLEVRKEVDDIFNSHVKTVEILKKFKLDDIQKNSEIFTNSKYLEFLKQKKKFLKSDRYLERVKDIYSSLPLSNSRDFYAARIIYQYSIYKESNQLEKTLILFGITGIFFGIIIILISNAVKIRKK